MKKFSVSQKKRLNQVTGKSYQISNRMRSNGAIHTINQPQVEKQQTMVGWELFFPMDQLDEENMDSLQVSSILCTIDGARVLNGKKNAEECRRKQCGFG